MPTTTAAPTAMRLNQPSWDRLYLCLVCAFMAVMARGAAQRGEAAPLSSQEAAIFAATLAMLMFSFTPAYTSRPRLWAVAAYRLLLCALLPPGTRQSAAQMQHAPAGLATDAARLIIVSRTEMLVLCSLGLPLELPAHLAVQLLCLALMLPRMHTCCLVPLLANPTQRSRIAALHGMAAGGTGMFAPSEQLLGGPQAQCTALLAFLLLFCGGVLPTLAIVRWTWLGLKATAHSEPQQQRLQGQQSGVASPLSSLGSASPKGSASPAGSSGRLSALSDASGCSVTASTGHDENLVARTAAPGDQQDGDQPGSVTRPTSCWVCTAAAAQCLPPWTVWVLEQAFPPVHGLPAALAAMYVPLLAAGSWLVACLLALATTA